MTEIQEDIRKVSLSEVTGRGTGKVKCPTCEDVNIRIEEPPHFTYTLQHRGELEEGSLARLLRELQQLDLRGGA